MGRAKKRSAEVPYKLKKDGDSVENKDLPFTKLPEKYILMRVNSGTKIGNVLRAKTKEGDNQLVPEIHILLSKEAQDTTELGYQAPGDSGQFNLQENTNSTEPDFIDLNLDKSNIPEDDNDSSAINIDSETSSTMELKFGKKRPNKNSLTSLDQKKRKIKERE
ncbi:uncharacterized protein LOC122514817 isoform X2 [Polistes fuscatus]|uniref:uncharacterized protein LOC122514817 isoform X2 n=1 Tax=Polistes fuscatus TaxID=30207 RepID=UPI001CA7BF07|nr:uncharacterized protein LOC122514817 isoform X2 [Polistes fuscatus]